VPNSKGQLDYEKFLTVLREELDRAVEPLSKDIKELSDGLKTMQANTYSREMMDNKLQVLNDSLKKHDEDLKGIHQLIGNSGRELAARVLTVISIVYFLYLLLPHILKGFGL
jgi:DNA-binding transcriptional regulator GbsR (MarR family)